MGHRGQGWGQQTKRHCLPEVWGGSVSRRSRIGPVAECRDLVGTRRKLRDPLELFSVGERPESEGWTLDSSESDREGD